MLVGHLGEQVVDGVEARRPLVLALDRVPRRLGDVGELEHLVFGARILLPLADRRDIRFGKLPATHRVFEARLEARLLFEVGHGEPVLHEDDAVFDEQPLEDRRLPEESPVLLGSAVVHYVFDARAVVPGAVEKHDFAGGRKALNVALVVPLATFPHARLRERDNPRRAWVQILDHPLDGAALARGIPALENDDDAGAGGVDPLLHSDQFDLQALELRLVDLLRDPFDRVLFLLALARRG